MSKLANIIRRVRIRGLVEGLIQRARIEGLPNDARDNVERHQNYGYAANPVEGEGLRLELGGHTIILTMDKIDSRPQLAAWEVAVWHKDGHKITLKDDGKVVVDCSQFIVNASESVTLNTPQVHGSGSANFAGNVTAPVITGTTNVVFGTISGTEHTHPIPSGGSETDPPSGS